MAVFTTQYRIRYVVPTDDGNREIRSVICGDRYGVQININKIIANILTTDRVCAIIKWHIKHGFKKHSNILTCFSGF